jgi:hypothetical protein
MKVTCNVISNITAGFMLHNGSIHTRSQQGLPQTRLMTRQRNFVIQRGRNFDPSEVLRRPNRSESGHTSFRLQVGEKRF